MFDIFVYVWPFSYVQVYLLEKLVSFYILDRYLHCVSGKLTATMEI